MISVLNSRKEIWFILFAIALGWLSVVDRYAEAYINSSLTGATASFGIAKLFDATVSTLSTLTFEVPFINTEIGIGQLLNPLYDMVNDFSDVMKYAISSLLIQKILVELLQTIHFKIFLTLSGLLYILSSFYLKSWSGTLYKIFVFSLVCKFSIALVAVGCSWVDHAFLVKQIDQQNEILDSYPVSPENRKRSYISS